MGSIRVSATKPKIGDHFYIVDKCNEGMMTFSALFLRIIAFGSAILFPITSNYRRVNIECKKVI